MDAPWIWLQMTLEDRFMTLMYDRVSSLMVLYTCSYFCIRFMKSSFACCAGTVVEREGGRRERTESERVRERASEPERERESARARARESEPERERERERESARKRERAREGKRER